VDIPVKVKIDLEKRTISTLVLETHYKKDTPFELKGKDGPITVLGGFVDKTQTTFGVKDGKLVNVVVASYEKNINDDDLKAGKGPKPIVIVGYESCH
jgi:hypothetical protein